MTVVRNAIIGNFILMLQRNPLSFQQRPPNVADGNAIAGKPRRF
jgi:hypothetical protein